MWSSMSSASVNHVDATPSISDVQVGKKKKTVKFPCMLCKGNHYSHLFPRMDEAASLLEKIHLPKSYRKLSSDPYLVDGLVNSIPSPVSLVDQVVNLVSSSIEPQTQVVGPVPSSISPALHQKSDTKVVDLFSSSVDPTLPLESDTKVVNLVLSSIDPTPPLTSAKVVAPITLSVNPTLPLRSAQVTDIVPSLVIPTLPLKSAKVVDPVSPLVDPIPPLRNVKVTNPVPSLVNPTLPLKSAKVVYPSPALVDPIQSSVDPTLLLESKPDIAHVFLVNTDSTVPRGIPPSPVKPPPSTETILFDWGALTRPHLPSHIPFHITVQVCGRDVPQTLIDEGVSVSILSFVA
jgi:hypothetical protein